MVLAGRSSRCIALGLSMIYEWQSGCNLRQRGVETVMKTKLVAILLLTGASMFAGPRLFVGVGVGPVYAPAPVVAYAPPPVPLAVAYAPPAPGYGYTWVGGYHYPVGARYAWHAGYWARPPYVGAAWVGPHWYGHRYYGGYWRHR
jgi:hypothetical protein